jgi:hypothetical protein
MNLQQAKAIVALTARLVLDKYDVVEGQILAYRRRASAVIAKRVEGVKDRLYSFLERSRRATRGRQVWAVSLGGCMRI